MDDRSMDAQARGNYEAWEVCWQIREALLSVPLLARRAILERAIQEANTEYGNEFEGEVRRFLADVLPQED